VGEGLEARDNAGVERTHDEFRCLVCGRLYCHIVNERFESVSEWWRVKQDERQQQWDDLPAHRHPRFGR
jgi:hypothetical protein